MAQKIENLRIRVPITPEVDQRSTKKAFADVRKIQRELSKFDVTWKGIGKQASMNVKEINKISTSAAQLGRRLGTAAKESYKELKQLGDQLEEAHDKAAQLTKQYAKAKGADKSRIGGEMAKQYKLVKDLNGQIDEQGKKTKKYNAEHTKAIKAHEMVRAKVQKSTGEMVADLKGVGKGVLTALTSGKGNISKALGAALQNAGEVAAKHTKTAAGAMEVAAGGPTGGSAALAGAAAGISAAVVAIGMLVKLLLAASNHMTDLNKALLKGSTLAGDFGQGAMQYHDTIRAISQAAQDSHGALLRFGLDSEKAMSIVGAFSKTSTGSMAKTKLALDRMGGTTAKGMEEFAKNAQVYGMALGMEATDVAGMMGNFVSEIGISSDHVMSTMAGIVKMAATSGMPVEKFMDVFRQVLPNVDLFTNRIEELTGAMKLLGKNMDPRNVAKFMQTMTKGFDQMDFKQRLKMQLILGDVPQRLKKDFSAQAKSIGKQMGGATGDIFTKAIQSKDFGKAQSAITDAISQGASGAVIDNAQQLLRNAQELQKGGLHTTTAMRGAGMMARMEMLKDYAGKLTGGDIGGLGEHVAKQLGVSEDEYKAILQLDNSMKTYTNEVQRTGLTHSESTNKALEENWKNSDEGIAEIAKNAKAQNPKEQHELFKLHMKQLKGKALEHALEEAATSAAEDTKDVEESAADLAAEQINATMSVTDKLESIVGYWLEKIYGILQPILDALDSMWGFMTSEGSVKEKLAATEASTAKKFGADQARNNIDIQSALGKQNGLTKDQTGQLQGMLSQLVVAAGSSTPADEAKALEPILNNAGKMSVAAYDAQSKQFNGFFRDNLAAQGMIRDHLAKAEELEKSGDKEGAGKEREAAQKIFADVMKHQTGARKYAILGSIAGGLAQSGVGVGTAGRGDPNAVASRQKLLKSQREAAQADKDISKEFQASLGAGGVTASGGTPKPSPALATGAPGAPAPVGPPAPGGPTPTDQKAAMDAHKDTAGTAEDSLKVQQAAADAADDTYAGISDVAGILKKGTRLEQSWMTTKFKNILKESSLDALRPALAEQLLGYAKIWDDPDLRKALAGEGGGKLLGAGGTSADILGLKGGGDAQDSLNALLKAKGVPGYATGITQVPRDMPAMLHAGEQIVPRANVGRGGGGKTVNVVIYAQGTPAGEIGHHVQKMSRSA